MSGQGTVRSKRTAQHYSCDSCRSRKLRCDRPTPCANCVSRGEDCRFSHVPTSKRRKRDMTLPAPINALIPDVAQQHHRTTPNSAAPSQLSLPPSQAPDDLGERHEILMAEIQAVKRVVQDLESRVSSSYPRPAQPYVEWAEANAGTGSTSCDSTSSPAVRSVWDTKVASKAPTPNLGRVGDAVAHLELVSMGNNLQERDLGSLDGTILFRVQCIRNIPEQSSYVMHGGKLMRCIHVPLQYEAKILAAKFLSKLSYVYHVLHGPSLPAMVEETYRHISNGLDRPGHMILLLSIIASSTHLWAADDCGPEGTELYPPPLFSSASEAAAQTALWIRAAHDVLYSQRGRSPPELETILGIVVLTYLTYNLEGASLQYRSLMMMGFVVGQELGLHRADGNGHGDKEAADAVRAEVGRRAWWYLVATDWISAARYGGPAEGVYHIVPHQMTVRKPLNIDDIDLLTNGPNLDQPLAVPTDMSYFLHRLRVAEAARAMVDDVSMAKAAAENWEPASHHSLIISLDLQLRQVIQDIPPFLDLDTYEAARVPEQDERFVQAYLLNSLIQSQRCKLHLDYLRSSWSAKHPTDSRASSPSRETCLYAARRIMRAERQLERTKHAFVQTRLRLSVILHGIFMATIVLLMDACVYGSGSQREPVELDDEVQDALRIVEEAKSHSLAAVRLHESLMHILARSREQQVERCIPSPDAATLEASMEVREQRDLREVAPLTGAIIDSKTRESSESSADSQVGRLVSVRSQDVLLGNQPPSAAFCKHRILDGSLEPTQSSPSLDEFMDMDDFEWELFSTLGTSSFF